MSERARAARWWMLVGVGLWLGAAVAVGLGADMALVTLMDRAGLACIGVSVGRSWE